MFSRWRLYVEASANEWSHDMDMLHTLQEIMKSPEYVFVAIAISTPFYIVADAIGAARRSSPTPTKIRASKYLSFAGNIVFALLLLPVAWNAYHEVIWKGALYFAVLVLYLSVFGFLTIRGISIELAKLPAPGDS
jgi:hypothetical protein